MLRTGPYGDGFGAVTAQRASPSTCWRTIPHGIDFGALEPRLPDVLRTPSGKIELAPPELVADCERLADAMAAAVPTTASCSSSAAATCGRTTRGCTTSRCW